MRISDIFTINFKKLKTKSKRAMFLIVPVGFLIALSVVVSSQVDNIQSAIKDSVFSSIANQYKLIKVETPKQEFDPSTLIKQQNSVEQNRFANSDVQAITNIDGVANASLQTTLPINNNSTTDLFADKTVNLNTLYLLDSQAATLYTQSDFTYKKGESIPIILNSNSFTSTYEDWSSGKTITIDMSSFKPGQGNLQRESFIKTEAISYNKDELIGKEFTIKFGALDTISDYETSRTGAKTVITKLSTAAYKQKITDRKTTIAQYWNYNKLTKPLTYTFKIVGIIDDKSTTNNYIPSSFADVVMNSYITRQINAKVAPIPVASLNSDFLGLTYNQDELTSQGGGIFGQIGKRFEGMRIGAGESSSVSFGGINIPGLVITLDENNTVLGSATNTKIYSKANKYGDTINIILKDVAKRSSVITALNNAGYAYQDTNELEVLNNLETTLNYISSGFLISFIVLIAGIVVLTTSKFLSESIKEIGIFRAIGMKQGDVLTLFMSQSLLYVLIGLLVGTGIGFGLNFLSATFVSSWFTSFIQGTISKTIAVVSTVESSIFFNTNWHSILLYSAVLLGISILISIIPSISASRVSPVEAIKSE